VEWEGGHIKETYSLQETKEKREKEKEKKVIINHIYDALREPAFERMDDR